MKFKALISSSLIFIFTSFYSAHCQSFEFAKIIGDTTTPQGSVTLKQLNNGDYIIGSEYYVKPTRGWFLTKTDFKGNSFFSIKAPNMNVYYVNPEVTIVNNNSFLMHSSILDSGFLKLWKLTCDSNGKNSIRTYNKYHIPAFDSISITQPEIHVKYVPNECFYIYGQSPYAPDSSYVIWKLDTSGKLIWRQDYFDTCNGNSFNLTEFKNKLLLTSGIYNNVMSGARLLWLDTMGNVTKENTVSTPLFPPNNETNNSLIVLSDTSIVMGFDGTEWDISPWPLIIKFNANLDTAWHGYIKIPRAKNNISSTDGTSIKKMVTTVDDNIGIYWYRNFNDAPYYSFGVGDDLRTYKSDGTLLSKVFIDSVYRFGISSYTDMIATSDKGFALTGQGSFSVTKSGSYLLKLNGFIVTGIDEPIEIGGGITMYPNPGRDMVTINSATQLESANICLYNIQGELIQSHPNFNGYSLTIERNNLPSGLYLLKIQNNKGEQFLKKIIFE